MTVRDNRQSLWNSFRSRLFYILLIFVLFFALSLNMLLHHQYIDHIDALSNDLIAQANENVIEKSSDYLIPAVLLSESVAKMATNGTIDVSDRTHLESLLLTILNPYPQLQAIYFGDENGNFYMVARDGNQTITKEVTHESNEIKTVYYTRDSNNALIDTREFTNETYDPRKRPWYKGAKNSGERFWTDVYSFFTTKKLGITASYPVYDHNQFKGAFGVDVSLSEISTFLNNQRISKKGDIFIVNEKNDLISFPASFEVSTKKLPIHVEALNRNEINEAISIKDTYGATKFTYTSDGKDYFASFVDFPETFGKKWTTALIVPNRALMINKVVVNRLFFIFLGLSILFIYLISILLTRSVFDPISQLIADMKKVSKLIFDEEVEIQNSVKEVNDFTQIYLDMKKKLKTFKNATEQHG